MNWFGRKKKEPKKTFLQFYWVDIHLKNGSIISHVTDNHSIHYDLYQLKRHGGDFLKANKIPDYYSGFVHNNDLIYIPDVKENVVAWKFNKLVEVPIP